MTPNEARQTIAWYRGSAQAERRDVLGKVARAELKQAYIVLARFALEVSDRMRTPRRKRTYIEMAGFYRAAAHEINQEANQ